MKAKAGTALKQQDDKKVVGRPFKPGQSGNPKGRPKKGIRYMNEMLAAE